MRKGLLLVLGLFISIALVGCGGSNDEDYLTSIKEELEGIGYVFEQRDADAIEYYNNKAVNEEYSIDVSLTDLYIGYINETTGWLELLEFESVADAESYVDGTSESGYIVYREGNVVFITFNGDAMTPFIDTGDKSGN